MNLIILIVLFVLLATILLYVVAQVIPLGSFIMFAAGLMVFLSINVYFNRRKARKERQTDEKEQ